MTLVTALSRRSFQRIASVPDVSLKARKRCSNWDLLYRQLPLSLRLRTFYSSGGRSCKDGPSKRYSDTLNLPKMPFSLEDYRTDGRAADQELKTQKFARFDELYDWQREQGTRESAETFTLHDGPPYANGPLHIGHALNKITKDIINRYKVMRGYRVHYVPGWDCHGLPIELQALKSANASPRGNEGEDSVESRLKIRQNAREFAKKAVETQKEGFQRWGVMGDWKHPYLTFSPEYVCDQMDAFLAMHEKGYIYQGYMPVYWSPSTRTALAESELEYTDDHISKSVFVKFRLTNSSAVLGGQPGGQLDDLSALIWTTTPWTLPANEAVCFNSALKYVIVREKLSGSNFLVCEDTMELIQDMTSLQLEVISPVSNERIGELRYNHPFRSEECSFLEATHVDSSKGTGLVHTAPSYGHEDFRLGLAKDLPCGYFVDEKGCYTSEVNSSELEGLNVLTEANDRVINILGDNVVFSHDYKHRYPYDWRSKQPVIIRASKQWFVDNNKVAPQAMKSLDSVKTTPAWCARVLRTQAQSRPYWCISRQRAWGAPIPVIYEKESGKPVVHRAIVDRLKCLIQEQKTSDVWWTASIEDFLTEDVIKQADLDPSMEYVKEKDILDVWFDSGTSWYSVLKECGGRADLCVEGHDQLAAWFQTSLLTSAALTGKSSYRNLIVHGFAVDKDGRKMSKSLGNVTSPNDVIYGRKKGKKRVGAFGADTLRWWAAYNMDKPKADVGRELLAARSNNLFTLRGHLRFLLGSLQDFDGTSDCVSHDCLLPQDQYMLHLLHLYCREATSLYDEFRIGDFMDLLWDFTATSSSTFYSNLIKDRLYCSETDDLSRRSAQTVLYLIMDTVTKSFAPVLPHLAEDIFRHYPQKENSGEGTSVFKNGWFGEHEGWSVPQLHHQVETIRTLAQALAEKVEPECVNEFDVALHCGGVKLRDLLEHFHGDVSEASSQTPLCELLGAARVSLIDEPPPTLPEDDSIVVQGHLTLADPLYEEAFKEPYTAVVLPAALNRCERCRRYTSQKTKEPCQRCLDVMSRGWA